jgi:hypothetical protein
MFARLFLDHPHSMGESYFDHQRVAFSFALSLLGAALACAVHALVPGLCASTGSRAVADLNERLVLNRRRQPAFEDRAWSA